MERLLLQIASTLIVPFLIGGILIFASHHTKPLWTPTMLHMGSGALFSLAIVPWVAFAAAYSYYDIINFIPYNRLCSHAEIKYLEEVESPQGIALIPDGFTHISKGRQSENNTIAKLLLNNTSLIFIERPPGRKSELYGQSKYEHLVIDGKKRIWNPETRKSTEYSVTPIDSTTAQYVIKQRKLFVPVKHRGLGGKRIEIYRATDNKLIAYAQYYWDNKTYKACPDEAHSGPFPYGFVTKAFKLEK